MNRTHKSAQTFVFLMVALTAIFLLCGLGIDTGLLFLAKARLSRAIDASVLAAVGNFNIPGATSPQDNRGRVALMMRNVAAANYIDLNQTYNSIPSEIDDGQILQPNGQKAEVYEYDFYASAGNSQTPLYYKVLLQSGNNGQIIQASAQGDVPTKTFFMGFGGNAYNTMGVNASSQAQRSPRLIMIVADRSGSMLGNQGATTLPDAIASFMSYFDPNNDAIGLVSFGSAGRLEWPLTTNFVYAATNCLTGCLDGSDTGESGDDADQDGLPSYYTNGVRRLKFGGATTADEGMRIAMEQLMSNSDFANPEVQKIMVIFTDGAWNTARTLVAAPGYTNVVWVPPATNSASGTNVYLTNASDLAYPVPIMTPLVAYTNSLLPAFSQTNSSWNSGAAILHTNDVLQSVDQVQENFTWGAYTWGGTREGAPTNVATSTYISNSVPQNKIYFAQNLDVWLPIGAVDYVYDQTGAKIKTVVSSLSSMTNANLGRTNIAMQPGWTNILVVPGYIMDGTVCNNLIVANGADVGDSNLNGYNLDNWQDHTWGTFPDTAANNLAGQPYSPSIMRNMLFRNFMNLLTGFVVYDAYDPLQTGPGGQDANIWLTDGVSHFIKPLHPYGEFYPSAPQFFCFNDMEFGPHFDHYGPSMPGGYYTTMNPSGSLLNGEAYECSADTNPNAIYYRAFGYSAVPQLYVTNNWNGQLFYFGSSDSAYSSGGTPVSSLQTAGGVWTQLSNASESWITTDFQNDMIFTPNQYTASSNAALLNATVWRPQSYRGIACNPSSVSQSDSGNLTGGYMIDDIPGGTGLTYNNSMAYSGRPTHYYDFSISSWVPIPNNHVPDGTQDSPGTNAASGVPAETAGQEVSDSCKDFARLCFWKSMEYSYHARQLGVTIYTIGFSSAVSNPECDVLASMANTSTYTNAGIPSGSNRVVIDNTGHYDPTQPVGLMIFATNAAGIGTAFGTIGQAVTGFLSGQ